MGGYANPAYLASLAEFGEPLWLAESATGILIQPIEGSGLFDSRGPYPLLSCRNWPAFARESASRDLEMISLVAVVDPFSYRDPSELAPAFPDLCRPYKMHHCVDFTQGYGGPRAEGHRRNLRKSIQEVVVERIEDPIDALPDWIRLYAELSARHSIQGIAAFSESAFASQLKLPELRAYRALQGDEVVAMSLWLADEKQAYYHLGAASERGYDRHAMFALFDRALREFADDGFETVNLGAGAGVFSDSEDGLSRFKAGWSNASKMSYLGGRIFDRDAYAWLSQGLHTEFFPAYRSIEALCGVAA